MTAEISKLSDFQLTDTSATPEHRWRCARAEYLLWAHWDEDYVVFHRPSGKTHLLNESGRSLLTEVLIKPLDSRQVIAALTGPDCDESAESSRDILATLYRFEQLGLVERV